MSEQIVIAVVTGVCGLLGGAASALVTGLFSRRRQRADEASIIAQASRQALGTVTESVIEPLREQVEYQERQISHLEEQQEKYFLAVAYTRRLMHWLQSFCEIVEPDFIARHPKPRLPDELRPDIAPETIPGPPEAGGTNHTPTGEEGR